MVGTKIDGKGLFESLGFKEEIKENSKWLYSDITYTYDDGDQFIEVEFGGFERCVYITSKFIGEIEYCTINKELLNAINVRFEELGFNK